MKWFISRGVLLAALVSVLLLSVASSSYGDLISELPGTYTGSWTNTTYGSTGAASFVITQDGGGLTLVADMDGYVFGQSDPAPVTISGTIVGQDVQFDYQDDPFFGDIAGQLAADGNLTATISDVPSIYIDVVNVTGTVGGGVIDLDYEVVFSATAGGGTAEGYVIARVPEPSGLALLAMALPALLRRKR